jgi:leucyl-tRNA synthetase
MDTFVDSSWYYFRYCDPHNEKAPFDSQTIRYWMPVDQYIGGIEHAVLHLIYTRLWTKIMRDLGLIEFGEPVRKLLTQGMVCLATRRCEVHDYLSPDEVADGKCKLCGRTVVLGRIEKMSKSKKNTIDPDEMVSIFGVDTVRLFMLFAAPPEKDVEWSEAGAEGASRFLNRVWRIVFKWHSQIAGKSFSAGEPSSEAKALRRKTHQTIKRVTHDIGARMNLNTAIAAQMELTNEIYAFDASIKGEATSSDLFAIKEAMDALAQLLAPFAPHIAEELWASLGHEGLVVASKWPAFDEQLARAEELEIPVQLNGKLVARVVVPADVSDDDLEAAALANEKLVARLDGRQIVKTVVVSKRLVNVVAR